MFEVTALIGEFGVQVRQTGQHPPWFSLTTALRARHRCKGRAEAARARQLANYLEGQTAYTELSQNPQDMEHGRIS